MQNPRWRLTSRITATARRATSFERQDPLAAALAELGRQVERQGQHRVVAFAEGRAAVDRLEQLLDFAAH